ncbi:nucleotidyltransferase domain-containing protein [Pseudarthrobacter enclensis]|uniref:nucleotidyltransferase domain-containing protein n=1 Tax=Pseudarthrobacter enclensis TaxID=993070 RepID=UPI0036B95695
MDPVSVARSFVAYAHPAAELSILGGSAGTGKATANSDLDIVILYPNGNSNYAETTRYQGWVVEAFVHTPDSVAFWYEKERAARCAVLGDICANGVLLTNRGGGESLQQGARDYMERGPEPLSSHERDIRRYDLSNSLDDLRGTTEPAERYAISTEVFCQVVELLLLHEGAWLGKGKWMVRRLEQLPQNQLAAQLLSWASSKHDALELAEIASEVLRQAGGYVMEGFVRGAR